MTFKYDEHADEEMRRAARAQRMIEMKRKKERTMRFRKHFKYYATGAVLLGVLLFSVKDKLSVYMKEQGVEELVQTQVGGAFDDLSAKVSEAALAEPEYEEEPQEIMEPLYEPEKPEFPKRNDNTCTYNGELRSERAVLIDITDNTVLIDNGMNERISPASMTKVMTVYTAAKVLRERSGDGSIPLDDTFTITYDQTDYSYKHDCSIVGFEPGENVAVKDLFYGTILPSGADAALALATYVAGSPEAFMELVNNELLMLGMSEEAHFTNCIGLYDENHYCTLCDIAMILKIASDDEFLRDVLSAHTYTTSQTEKHPEGIIVSNWFLRRIEDKDTHGEVLCAKTGFVDQSLSCAVSLQINDNGREYICVTQGAGSSWQCIYDHVDLYNELNR